MDLLRALSYLICLPCASYYWYSKVNSTLAHPHAPGALHATDYTCITTSYLILCKTRRLGSTNEIAHNDRSPVCDISFG